MNTLKSILCMGIAMVLAGPLMAEKKINYKDLNAMLCKVNYYYQANQKILDEKNEQLKTEYARKAALEKVIGRLNGCIAGKRTYRKIYLSNKMKSDKSSVMQYDQLENEILKTSQKKYRILVYKFKMELNKLNSAIKQKSRSYKNGTEKLSKERVRDKSLYKGLKKEAPKLFKDFHGAGTPDVNAYILRGIVSVSLRKRGKHDLKINISCVPENKLPSMDKYKKLFCNKFPIYSESNNDVGFYIDNLKVSITWKCKEKLTRQEVIDRYFNTDLISGIHITTP